MDATAPKREQAAPQDNPMLNTPGPEHDWLTCLIGSWTYHGNCMMGPDMPSETFTGRETVRSLGGLWTIAEGEGEMPGGGMAHTIQTLGYDPKSGRYVGSWVGSMMAHLWCYEGDRDGSTLTLESDGPRFDGNGTARYRDTIEIRSNDHRTLTSHVLDDQGNWMQIMSAEYHRTQ